MISFSIQRGPSFLHSILTCVLLSSALLILSCSPKTQTSDLASTPPTTPAAIDWRDTIEPSQFTPAEPKTWISPTLAAQFPFDELIYSWSARVPSSQGFRLYLQVDFAPGDSSPWLYGGYWGTVKLVSERKDPTFERGRVAMDQLLLKQKAVAYRFKVVDEGDEPLKVLPKLYVIITDNEPPAQLAERFAPVYTAIKHPERILDLPLRRQMDSQGNPMPDRCQSAALAAAMQYYGKVVHVEDIVALAFDPEYNYPGIWPRTLGAGVEFGYDAYIDRFRDWTAVRNTIAQNKVILCSIRMPKNDTYIAPPYADIGGHIVALNGITDDGRVVVTDSALGKSGRGFRCQWLREDFEKIWMRNKGGVGMVICPPPGAALKLVDDLPPFPESQYKTIAESKFEE